MDFIMWFHYTFLLSYNKFLSCLKMKGLYLLNFLFFENLWYIKTNCKWDIIQGKQRYCYYLIIGFKNTTLKRYVIHYPIGQLNPETFKAMFTSYHKFLFYFTKLYGMMWTHFPFNIYVEYEFKNFEHYFDMFWWKKQPFKNSNNNSNKNKQEKVQQ